MQSGKPWRQRKSGPSPCERYENSSPFARTLPVDTTHHLGYRLGNCVIAQTTPGAHVAARSAVGLADGKRGGDGDGDGG
jgi:hypothetical protein